MIITLAAVGVLALATAAPAPAPLLTAAGVIPLGVPKGEISDLAIDYADRRLFVLERDAGGVAVVELPSGVVTQTLSRLPSPRGLAHEAPNN